MPGSCPLSDGKSVEPSPNNVRTACLKWLQMEGIEFGGDASAISTRGGRARTACFSISSNSPDKNCTRHWACFVEESSCSHTEQTHHGARLLSNAKKDKRWIRKTAEHVTDNYPRRGLCARDANRWDASRAVLHTADVLCLNTARHVAGALTREGMCRHAKTKTVHRPQLTPLSYVVPHCHRDHPE